MGGCSYNIIFTLLIPVKLPVYFLRRHLGIYRRRLILFVSTIRIITGVFLAIVQREPLNIIIRSRIRTSGILVRRVRVGIFNIYYIIYGFTLMIFLYGLYINDRSLIFLRLSSFLGIPLLPIFLPKVFLLIRYTQIPFFFFFFFSWQDMRFHQFII